MKMLPGFQIRELPAGITRVALLFVATLTFDPSSFTQIQTPRSPPVTLLQSWDNVPGLLLDHRIGPLPPCLRLCTPCFLLLDHASCCCVAVSSEDPHTAVSTRPHCACQEAVSRTGISISIRQNQQSFHRQASLP